MSPDSVLSAGVVASVPSVKLLLPCYLKRDYTARSVICSDVAIGMAATPACHMVLVRMSNAAPSCLHNQQAACLNDSSKEITIMGKGDKQHGNREAKKPKANKKLAPAGAGFLKQQDAPAKPAGKPAKSA